ncbi:hypothetical protein TI39_contig304g00007 [Zymoseptoria brevis]|uniref:Uncharacterized protein n=1 Tax=Zymoseptoria brevis TaxID=1047168 RepID=A0A0F4GVI5_9PEZI|nr:hypothetical protein TI39_contig304g00007 [Zymoseptoria brevis]
MPTTADMGYWDNWALCMGLTIVPFILIKAKAQWNHQNLGDPDWELDVLLCVQGFGAGEENWPDDWLEEFKVLNLV